MLIAWNLPWLTILAVLLSTLSGCRVGNREEKNPPPAPKDPLSGYYEMDSKTLQYCVVFSDATPCTFASLKDIPETFQRSFSNPSGFLIDDPANNIALVFNPLISNPAGFPIYYDIKNGHETSLGVDITFKPSSVMGIKACNYFRNIRSEGSLEQEDSKSIQGFSTRGRLRLEVENTDSFEGNCGTALLDLEECYLDDSKCGGLENAINLDEIFGTPIRLGLLTVNQIHLLRAIFYHISYP